MGFSFRFCVGLQLLVLLGVWSWSNVATARSRDRITVQITVVVNDGADVSRLILYQGETEAGRILGAAGIQIQWMNCSGDTGVVEEACRVVARGDQLVLHIVPTGKTSTDSVFGMAFLAQDGSGKYCDVFFDRVEEAHRRYGADRSQLLGTVVAHELGHLLLGSHAHSRDGIMAPVWEEESLRNMGMGHLLFTREQSSLMKMRVSNEDLRLAGLR
jgi:hypothetical protein